jgi:hypothetical protein
MKYLVHNGETYYPFAEEFTSLADAVQKFRELRARRVEKIKNGGNLYFDKDYLCIVIEELDPIQMAKEIDASRLSKKEPPGEHFDSVSDDDT